MPTQVGRSLLYSVLYLLRTGAQFVVRQCLYLGVDGLHLLHQRLYGLHVALGLVAEDTTQKIYKFHINPYFLFLNS